MAMGAAAFTQMAMTLFPRLHGGESLQNLHIIFKMAAAKAGGTGILLL